MRSSGVRPSDQSEWLWQSPMRSLAGHEPRQPAIRGGLDLAPVLAQLGLDRLEVEPAVEVRLALERLEVGHLGGLARRGVERDEAVLRQAPAPLLGALAEPHVVRGGTREVDEVGAETSGRRGHDVELGPLAQREAGARRAVRDGLGGALVALVREGREQPGHRPRRVIGLDEQVEVADRLGPASGRPRDRRRADVRDGLRERDQTLGERVRIAHQHPA